MVGRLTPNFDAGPQNDGDDHLLASEPSLALILNTSTKMRLW